MKRKIKYAIFVIVMFLTLISRTAYAQSPCLEADIIFVTDWSGSMNFSKSFIVRAFKDFVDNMNLSSSGVKVGFISYNDDAYVDLELSSDSSQIYAMLYKLMSKEVSGNTHATPALFETEEMFLRSAVSRGKIPRHQVVILISDGLLDDTDLSIEMSKYLRDEFDIQIYAVHVGKEGSGSDCMKKISKDAEHFLESDYETLRETLRNIDPCL